MRQADKERERRADLQVKETEKCELILAFVCLMYIRAEISQAFWHCLIVISVVSWL